MMFFCYLLSLLGLTLSEVVLSQEQACEDIDSNACALLVAASSGYCSTETAIGVCPKFCKLCPVECYHCNTTITDFHECNTTKLCGQGELCMTKELRSSRDGHHEYQLTCEALETCDGQYLTLPFVGKRGIKQRDISITCCNDDLCNYPKLSTTAPSVTKKPDCPKDIVFMVDETSSFLLHHNDIMNEIINIASTLDIGPTENLIGLYGYGSTIHERIDLDQHMDKTSLLHDLKKHGLSAHPGGSHVGQAVDFLVDHALTTRNGDRAGYPDVVVIIGDSNTMSNTHVSLADKQHLIQNSQDIILVTVGTTSQTSLPLDHQLATDKHHVLHVQNTSNLSQQLLPLITQC
ncbi:hypothetical protein ACF0H5_012081 [Mactra antiquata]